MRWQSELEIAADLAREAGEALSAWMRKDKHVLSDAGKDVKLQADCDSEAIILRGLGATGYPILTEESGEIGVIEGDAPFWVVDPLDGTLNYSRGIPLCCVSIALCSKDHVLAGVIYDFNRGECFQGAADGAQLNGQSIHVSMVKEKKNAVLMTGFPVGRDFGEKSLGGFLGQVQDFKKIRLLGSAALSLAYLACGRGDAYAEDDIRFWDVAAGIAIVQGAGGYVQLTDSAKLPWSKMVRCAAHEEIWAGS